MCMPGWVFRSFGEDELTADRVWWIDAKSEVPEERLWLLLPRFTKIADEP